MQPDLPEALPRENNLVVFRSSSIHGLGGFARSCIPKDTRIIEYVGERIDKHESARRCEANNVYIFSLNAAYDVDGNVGWNPARLLNHSCSPNCEAQLEGEGIWIVAARNISPGEELTFNYGFDLENYQDYPCHCGSPHCVGFIVAEEFFGHLRRQAELQSLGQDCGDSERASWPAAGDL